MAPSNCVLSALWLWIYMYGHGESSGQQRDSAAAHIGPPATATATRPAHAALPAPAGRHRPGPAAGRAAVRCDLALALQLQQSWHLGSAPRWGRRGRCIRWACATGFSPERGPLVCGHFAALLKFFKYNIIWPVMALACGSLHTAVTFVPNG
jgi:hypothetical protein